MRIREQKGRNIFHLGYNSFSSSHNNKKRRVLGNEYRVRVDHLVMNAASSYPGLQCCRPGTPLDYSGIRVHSNAQFGEEVRYSGGGARAGARLSWVVGVRQSGRPGDLLSGSTGSVLSSRASGAQVHVTGTLSRGLILVSYGSQILRDD